MNVLLVLESTLHRMFFWLQHFSDLESGPCDQKESEFYAQY